MGGSTKIIVNSSLYYSRYEQLLGCDNVNLTNTTTLYARYTTSVICNAIVQNSIQPCSLSNAASTPLCAESCVSQEAFGSNLCTDCCRPNRRQVKRRSLSMVSFAEPQMRPTWIRFVPTLPIALCRPTPSVSSALPARKMNRLIVATQTIYKASAVTALQALQTRRIPAALPPT